MSIKLDVDGYLSSQWEQHCKQQEEYEMNEFDKRAKESADLYAQLKDNPVTVTITIEQLAIVVDALESGVNRLEERIRQSEGSEFEDLYLARFKEELTVADALSEKLSAIWWKVSRAEEGL